MKPSPKLSLLTTALLVLALFASACSSDPSTEDGSGSDPDSGDTGSQDGSPAGDGSGAAGDESAAQGVTVRIDGPGGQTSDTEIIISLDNASGQTPPAPSCERPRCRVIHWAPLVSASCSTDFLTSKRRKPIRSTSTVRPTPAPGHGPEPSVDQAFPPPADVARP